MIHLIRPKNNRFLNAILSGESQWYWEKSQFQKTNFKIYLANKSEDEAINFQI